jgi:hypothetical protein
MIPGMGGDGHPTAADDGFDVGRLAKSEPSVVKGTVVETARTVASTDGPSASKAHASLQ